MDTPATSADEQAFLNAIIANPDDDTPRLQYADWLEEHAGTVPCVRCRGKGEHSGFLYVRCDDCSGSGTVPDSRRERAEFIRVQCELARMPEPVPVVEDGLAELLGAVARAVRKTVDPYAAERDRLRRRERELIPGDRLYYGTGDYEYIHVDPDDFRRGFIDHVSCPAADWERHGDAIAAAQPVRRVTLTTRPEIVGVPIAVSPDHAAYRVAGVMVVGAANATPKEIFEARWKRQTFDLPPEPVMQSGDGNGHADAALYAAGVISMQTLRSRLGLDPAAAPADSR